MTFVPCKPLVESEPMPELQAAVATLSTGPVGPGDMVGGTNRSLLMRWVQLVLTLMGSGHMQGQTIHNS